MEAPFSAYSGDDPFIFVCYAHEDSAVVYPEMQWLKEHGLNLWYDEGISGGANWRGAIGDSLLAASHVLFYVSRRSLASDHCNREIGLALDEGKTIVPVYLENVELTSDLKVGLNRVHALHRDDTPAYRQHLLQALGHVQALGHAAATPDIVPAIRKKHAGLARVAGAALVFALLAGTGWWYWSRSGEPPASSGTPVQPSIPSIAVLPFVNMSNDADQEFFSDGISEEILTLIAKNPAIRVISRSSAFSFKGTNTELPVIAEKLGVDHVLEGSVRRSGNTVRVSVQLIDALSDGFLWSETYDRTLDDIFVVQSEIAGHVARELKVALGDAVPEERNLNPEAYLLYSQARHLLGLGSLDNAARARELLQQAVELDPGFVSAWTELARAYGQFRGAERDAGDKASAAVEQALALDPDDPVANAWQGWQLAIYDGAFEAAIPFYNRSLAVDPTNVDVLRGLVVVLRRMDQAQRALQVADYVVDRDPLCVICINNLVIAYERVGREDDAAEQLRRAIVLNPESRATIRLLAINHLLRGDGAGAHQWIDQLPDAYALTAALRAIAFHEQNRTDEQDAALSLARQIEPSGYAEAIVLAWIGESDRAFALLENIADEQPLSLAWLRNLLWRDLRADPRWQRLLEDNDLSAERFARVELQLDLPG